MLSRLLLTFEDEVVQAQYLEERKAYYSKAFPIVASLVLILSVFVEVVFRIDLFKSDLYSLYTSIANWICFVLLFSMSFLIRKFQLTRIFLCPIITIFVYYYLIVVDYDDTSKTLQLREVIGITTVFLFNVFFNEMWILNSFIFAPLFAFNAWKQNQSVAPMALMESDLDPEHTTTFVIKIVYPVAVYCAIAYRSELTTKQSHLGMESNEKAFNRWLKVFETFPEGIAMVRNDDQVIYANNSLTRLLEFADGAQDSTIEHPKTSGEKYETNFKNTKIKAYKRMDSTSRVMPTAPKEITLWDYIQGSETQGTFELKIFAPMQSEPNLDNSQSNDLLTKQKMPASQVSVKYLKLQQVGLRIGGRQEKLIIVRDDSYKINLQDLCDTKLQMQNFTDQMITEIDENALVTSETLKVMEGYVMPEGRLYVEDSIFELKRMRYRIRDYRDVYDIAENEFEINPQRKVNLKTCVKEIKQAVQNDINKQGVEVSVAMHDSTPQFIFVDQDVFIQVMINLLQQTVHSIGGRGFIKIGTYTKLISGQMTVVADFDASKFTPDKQMTLNIINLAQERDIKVILQANVDLNFKISKILCNQMGWRIEYNSFTASRYSLFIPLVKEVEDDGSNIEETKEEAAGEKVRVISSSVYRGNSKQSQRDMYQDNYEQLEQYDEGKRPWSQQIPVPSLVSTGMKFHRINVVKEEPHFENQPPSPSQQSTRTLGLGSQARARLHNRVEQQDMCLLMNFTQKTMFEEINLKCVEVYTESEALKKIQKSLLEPQQFKYFFIDMDDQRVNLKWMSQAIKDEYNRDHVNREKVTKLRIVVMASQITDKVLDDCQSYELGFSLRPSTNEELRKILAQLESASPSEILEYPIQQSHQTNMNNNHTTNVVSESEV